MSVFIGKYFVKYNCNIVPRVNCSVIPSVVKTKDKKLVLNLTSSVYVQSPKMDINTEGVIQTQQNDHKIQQFFNTLKSIEDQLLFDILEKRKEIFSTDIDMETVKSFFTYKRRFNVFKNMKNADIIFELNHFELKDKDIIPVYSIYKYKEQINISDFLNVIHSESESETDTEESQPEPQEEIVDTYLQLEQLINQPEVD